jgi:Protein of unknown function (DUF1573)
MRNIQPVIISILILTFWGCSESQPPQSVLFENTVINVGNVKPGDSITVKFSFTNKAKQKIQIDTVVPDCSCTVFNFMHEPIESGQKGEVSLKYRNFSDSGFFQKSAVVKFKQDTSTYVITMAGNK